jgi:RimJ/RimL family protein N-acetyltransferase
MIPHLETERLRLREFRADDFEAYATFMADPEVARYIAPAPMSREDAWRSLASTIGHWTLRGYGTWAVERKADGAFMGRVGMINPEGWPGLEIGWTLGRPYWGRGYATEAALASMRYAFLTQPVDRLISNIDPANTASQSVARRIGETYPVDIWVISREEWKRRNAA